MQALRWMMNSAFFIANSEPFSGWILTSLGSNLHLQGEDPGYTNPKYGEWQSWRIGRTHQQEA